VETILLDGHFVVEHGARSAGAPSSNFNGTPACGGRKAIDDAGGWEHTPSPRTPIFLIARSSKAGSFSTSANRMRFRASRGHERLQSPAGAVGQGLMQTAKKILQEF